MKLLFCKQSILAIINVDLILLRVLFQSEISIQVYMIPNRYFIPDRVFDPNWKIEWSQSETSCNSTRMHVNKNISIPYSVNRNGVSSIRIAAQFGFT